MRVTRISTTPVKGLGLNHPAEVQVRVTGVVGDRVFYLVDERDTLFSIAKTGAFTGLTATFDEERELLSVREGGRTLVADRVVRGDAHEANFFSFKQVPGWLAPGPWDALFTERASRPVRLVRARDLDGAHDVEPLSFLGEASTARLAEQAGSPSVDGRRFRMLFEFDGAAAHAEDGWEGRHLRVGTMVARIGGPVQRCAGTTRNPDSGSVDLNTLSLIGDYRGRHTSIFGLGFNFCVYGSVVTEGAVRLGDDLELLD